MKIPMKKSLILLAVLFPCLQTAQAAKPVNLMEHPVTNLQSLAEPNSNITIVETSRSEDANQNQHIRMQEMYMNYPVFGADMVLHIPHEATSNASLSSGNKNYMNGIFYQDLNADLANTPASAFTKHQADLALQATIEKHLAKIKQKANISDKKIELMVYVDQSNKAHWVYQISFFIPGSKTALPSRPVYLVDAQTFEVYLQWDDIQTSTIAEKGGGYGGNTKKVLIYDGLANHLAFLPITRDTARRVCTLQNKDVFVGKKSTGAVISYSCPYRDVDHNNVYWNGSSDYYNGGYSPSNDAMYNGMVVKKMYQNWYHIPVLVNKYNKTPMLLKMYVHDRSSPENSANAYWDGSQNIMVFGDGDSTFYPLTSLGITAHEVSHGFTQQHSNLVYTGHAGGMNESFSDMASQAAEFFSYGESSWQIGGEVIKYDDVSLRYMDTPSKDCYGDNTPGDNCSIDNANQYFKGMDPHYSSGVYNRFFYLLSNTEGWDSQKAFDVMVNANSHFWTRNPTFNTAACNVLQSAAELKMDLAAIKTAFDTVGVDYSTIDTMTPPGKCVVNGVVVERNNPQV